MLSELIIVMPELERTRWRKKSDFYSLFLVLSKHYLKLPLSRDGRKDLRVRLLGFAEKVDSYLTDPKPDRFEGHVVEYALAVERAASDLNNRKIRDRVLCGIIEEIVGREAAA